MKRTREKLSAQVERKIKNAPERKTPEYDGSDMVVSTGSTLLDLAISGGRFPEGGIPTGILVEIFGPSGAGKTVLLCQIAGNVQRLGGAIKFHDPEARLNKQFARMFGLDVPDENYHIPSTIPEVFSSVRDWLAKRKGKELHGVFADSLAALSTDMEMGDTGDKMGMRRAKEFSEELRKTCRIITQSGALVVCSNQVRQNLDAGPYGQRYKSPGGEAIGFYASLRLRCSSGEKIKVSRSIRGKEHKRVIGVKTNIEVFKSSVWKPFRAAEVYIIFDYGIDDIRANLKFVKDSTGDTIYRVGEVKLGRTLDRAIREVEERGLEQELKEKTIELWKEIEKTFEEKRKPREW
jgi:recombination protein RecA